MKYDKILLEHGGGGLLSNELISEYFLPRLKNTFLERLEESAVLSIGNQKFCFTTDSYVVSPVFFPCGNIGSLAVHGAVNNFSVCGGQPLYMSCGFILEEGFSFESLQTIIQTMAEAAAEANVKIVTGGTKVVAHDRSADGRTGAANLLVYCLMNTLSYRPQGDFFPCFKFTKISRYTRNDNIEKVFLKFDISATSDEVWNNMCLHMRQ